MYVVTALKAGSCLQSACLILVRYYKLNCKQVRLLNNTDMVFNCKPASIFCNP